MTIVDEARAALESFVHALAPTKTLTGEQHQELMRLSDTLIAAVRAETPSYAELADIIRKDAETLRALREAVAARHRYVEIVNSDGDERAGCICEDPECELYALAATPAEDEEGRT